MNNEFLVTSCVCLFSLCILFCLLAYCCRDDWYRKANLLSTFFRGVLFIACSLVILFTIPVLFVGTLFLIATVIMSMNHIILGAQLDKEMVGLSFGILTFFLFIIPSVFCLDWLEKTSDEYIRWHK